MKWILGWLPIWLLIFALGPGCNGGGDKPDSGAPDDGEDAGFDGADITGDDADADAGPPWSWCPSPSDYVGGDWSRILRVTEGGLYCGTFDEMRTLEEELPVKCRMRMIPGDYPVPDSNDQRPFVLPLCFEFIEPGSQPLLDGVGSIQTSYTADGYSLSVSMPLRTQSGQSWAFVASLNGRMIDNQLVFVFDGRYVDPWPGPWVDLHICTDCPNFENFRRFDSCHFQTARPQRHTVTFQDGRVELYIQMGESGDSTEPAAFVRATGTVDGEDFEQTDYYRLIYNPTHHHFTRDFGVLFDAPIGGACGLKIENLVPWDAPLQGRLTTIRCDLSEIEERVISEETFEWL